MKIDGEIEREGENGKRRKVDTDPDSKENLVEEAKERQFYDPVERVFNFSKKRVTDMKECAEVYLPKPKDEKAESEIEMLRNIVLVITKRKKK